MGLGYDTLYSWTVFNRSYFRWWQQVHLQLNKLIRMCAKCCEKKFSKYLFSLSRYETWFTSISLLPEVAYSTLNCLYQTIGLHGNALHWFSFWAMALAGLHMFTLEKQNVMVMLSPPEFLKDQFLDTVSTPYIWCPLAKSAAMEFPSTPTLMIPNFT